MNQKTATIDILGTEYTVVFEAQAENMPEDSDGCMDNSTKTIMLAKLEGGRGIIKDLDTYRKKVLRHEIIHAFLYESGLWNNSGNVVSWATSEEITDWIAIQFPKMQKVFEEVGCL